MNEVQKSKCHAIIHSASTTAAAIGAGLAQLPGSDSAIIIPVQITMVISLGNVFNMNLTESAAKTILLGVTGMYLGRTVSQFLVGWIPGIGNAINASTAAGITESIGWNIVKKFDNENLKVSKTQESNYTTKEVQFKAEEYKNPTLGVGSREEIVGNSNDLIDNINTNTIWKSNERNELPTEKGAQYTVSSLNISNNKPSIFVNASLEATRISEKLKEFFPEEEFDLDVWRINIFKDNILPEESVSNLELINNFTDIYDFAIFVFVLDDKIVNTIEDGIKNNRNQEIDLIRRNLLFEYGQFLGHIGAKMSFILYDNKIKQSINFLFDSIQENEFQLESNKKVYAEMYSYNGDTAINSENYTLLHEDKSLENASISIRKRIITNYQTSSINFLPSTALAYTYYKNFIAVLVKNINILKSNLPYPASWIQFDFNKDKLDQLRVVIQSTKKINLKIVVPTYLEFEQQTKFIYHFNKDKFDEMLFPGNNRPTTLFYYKLSSVKANESLVFYDVPTILNNSIEVIEDITPYTDIRKILIEKELRSFRTAINKKMLDAEKLKETINIFEIVEVITFKQFFGETDS